MNRLMNSVLAIAVAFAAVTPAFAEGDAGFELNYGQASKMIRKNMEGASGLALFKTNRAPLSAQSSWSEIKGRALPDWPTISFPNGMAYILPSVCVSGNDLHYKYAKTDEVCVVEGGEAGCLRKQVVPLTISRDFTNNVCTSWVTKDPVMHGELYEPGFTTCTGWTTQSGRHELEYLVDVRGTPQSNGGEDYPLPGKLLFQKTYTIEACK